MATKVKPSRLQVSGTPQAGCVPVYVNEDCFQRGAGGGGGGGSAEWGNITGTLCDQIDLQGALNCKLDASALSNTNYGGAWSGDTTHTPTKNAIYTKLHTMDVEIGNKAADNTVVKLSGNQTIAGTKTFSTSPVVPDKCVAVVNCGTAIATEAQVYNVATSAELKCNMVCDLTGADNSHYPSAKAVADAITASGGGDMLKAVYDPNGIEANAFDYCNFTNTPTIPTDNCQLANSCGYTTCTGTLVAADLNPYATCTYVNNSINSVTAYYITKNAQGDQFACYAELANATTFYSGGVQRTPTRNDYTIVLDDECYSDATTRYIYNSNWEYQYTVNETALTQSQLDALNSGITAAKVCCYDAIPVITDNCQIANGCGYTTCTGTISNCAGIISALGYTPYNSTNPNGYTTCTGTLVAGDISGLVAENCIACINGCCLTQGGNICICGGGGGGGIQLAPNSEYDVAYHWYGPQACYEALSQYYTCCANDTAYFTS